MFLLKGSTFEMHTSDPDKARLVIESNEPGKKITPEKQD